MTTIYFQTEEISKFDINYYKNHQKIKLLDYNVSKSKNTKYKISKNKKDKIIKKINDDVNNKYLCDICNCYIKNYKIHTKSKKHKHNELIKFNMI